MMCLACKNVKIRYITEKDLIRYEDEIIELIEDNLNINFPNINKLTEFAISGYKDMIRFKRDNSAILIGAFEEDMIIGFLWAYVRNILGEIRIHIDHIIVDSKARSKGIGTKLLNNLENLSREKGIKKIELMTTLENESTMKFYNSKGFSTVRVQLEKKLGEIDVNR